MKVIRSAELFRSACIFASLMCLLALLPMPMLSFQTASRYVAMVAAVWASVAAFCDRRPGLGLFFAVVAITLNPFIALLPTVGSMRAAGIASAALFLYASLRLDPGHLGGELGARSQ